MNGHPKLPAWQRDWHGPCSNAGLGGHTFESVNSSLTLIIAAWNPNVFGHWWQHQWWSIQQSWTQNSQASRSMKWQTNIRWFLWNLWNDWIGNKQSWLPQKAEFQSADGIPTKMTSVALIWDEQELHVFCDRIDTGIDVIEYALPRQVQIQTNLDVENKWQSVETTRSGFKMTSENKEVHSFSVKCCNKTGFPKPRMAPELSKLQGGV